MKNLLITGLLLFIQVFLFAQVPEGLSKKNKIYLVRHAEKKSGSDPVLTEEGNTRAGALLQVLKGKKIHHIYVTQFKRTQMTGDSLRLQMGIDTIQYKADTTGQDLYKMILANNEAGKSLLIIGHSNTVPKLIKKLGVINFDAKDIPDNEFDNLYLITYKKGKAVVKKMKYGAASAASATMKQ
ncbi:SixA phosphatase family protein [Ferruginibacter sp. SUN106]|uniref:SixA phosphatase family protein n=1 Tax=Ferruginibacter sp. SUN106 TaxID=2978348 RepID=UPI003D35CFA8